MDSSATHRHCFILKGSQQTILANFMSLCENLSSPLICAHNVDAYTSSKLDVSTCTFKQAKQHLGRSHEAILVDLTQGISASVLAILAGTVRGGGVFAIGLPETGWHSHADLDLPRYLPWPYETEQVTSYFKEYFLKNLYAENSPFKTLPTVQTLQEPPKTALPALSKLTANTPLTNDQVSAQHQLFKAKAASYVLIAPRGRGKSTLLGDSIAHLIAAGKRVVVTAPNQTAVDTLAERFAFVQLTQAQSTHTQPIQAQPAHCQSIQTQQNEHKLPFMAPDALIANSAKDDTQHWDYLFVDEAAMIPLPLLVELNKRAKHTVFSTTDYGYEGAGKGFGIRFCDFLAAQSNDKLLGLNHLTLQRPIRWGENDPLENWLNHCFLLAPPADEKQPSKQEALKHTTNQLIPDKYTTSRQTAPGYRHLTGHQWLEESEIFTHAFSLLVNAHYQTSPDNLRWVLDDPSMSAYLSTHGKQLNSVAIVSQEGSLPDDLCLAVMQGTRRPRGHLVPLSLLAHEGMSTAGQFCYWRISRIATQQTKQNQGLGSALLKHIEEQAIGQCDFLCTSFAATGDVLSFWLKNGFIPVRLGMTKDQASGCYSVMMVKPLNASAEIAAKDWHQRYLSNLLINLPRDYPSIDEGCVKLLMKGSEQPSHKHSMDRFTKQDQQDLTLFAEHHRPYLTIRAQLTRLVNYVVLQNLIDESHPDYALLKAVVTQAHSQIEFEHYDLKSKKQVEKHLKKLVKSLLNEMGGNPPTNQNLSA